MEHPPKSPLSITENYLFVTSIFGGFPLLPEIETNEENKKKIWFASRADLRNSIKFKRNLCCTIWAIVLPFIAFSIPLALFFLVMHLNDKLQAGVDLFLLSSDT